MISIVLGWIYTVAWSVSFYPQLRHNIVRRCTTGLSPDYPLLNSVGFAAYTFSTAAFLYSDAIRSQYSIRYPRSSGSTVEVNDFVFALHGFILCIVSYSQFWPQLWGFDSAAVQRASHTARGILYACPVTLAGLLVLIVCSHDTVNAGESLGWNAIDFVYAASFIKVYILCIKYTPQIYENYRLSSTAGWAVSQTYLDAIGGVFSLIQLLLDSKDSDSWSGVTGNPAKFFLAVLSLLYDAILLLQHYYLYPIRNEAMDP